MRRHAHDTRLAALILTHREPEIEDIHILAHPFEGPRLAPMPITKNFLGDHTPIEKQHASSKMNPCLGMNFNLVQLLLRPVRFNLGRVALEKFSHGKRLVPAVDRLGHGRWCIVVRVVRIPLIGDIQQKRAAGLSESPRFLRILIKPRTNPRAIVAALIVIFAPQNGIVSRTCAE